MSAPQALRHPHGQIAALGTPQDDETVLWRGKPDLAVMARTAFHTRKVGLYFTMLAAIALALGSVGGAVLTALAGALCLALLYALAWTAVRTSEYVLTDRRIILRIGMAIEKSINLPLKRIEAAHLTDRGAGYGDIAIEPAAGHGLGYGLLWPHARPLKINRPQPMLRALPDAAGVARLLAEATAAHQAIARAELPAMPEGTAPAGLKEALA